MRRTKSPRRWSDVSEIFRHRRAAAIRPWERWILLTFIFLGIQSTVDFGLWWFQRIHVNNPFLFVLLSIATWYGILRIFIGWYNTFHAEQPDVPDAPAELSVAIFITSSPGEPYDMFVRTLEAARNISYPHQTYLLDDTRDARFAELATEHGAIHLEIVGFPGAKAGKINEALTRTSEEFILVLDPDHIPFENFLDRVLGFFGDERIGFIQVSQAYYNAGESFVARAAAEQTFAFYGPIMQGMHGTGTAVAIGANCTFRRAALASIGGHGVGLAEDLVTSIRLHAAGWKSVYLPEVLSRGLVPADLGSFMKQQLKWSRGVHDVLFQEYPKAFRRLTFHQKLSYLMIGTYYFVGVTSLIYMLIPILHLWTGAHPAAILLSEYLRHALPVGILAAIIYRFAQRWVCDPDRERGWHWRGMLLKVGLWSVHFLGLALAILRIAVPYVPTEKIRRTGNFWTLARVPMTLLLVGFLTTVVAVYERLYVRPESEVRITTEVAYGMIFFLLMNSLLMSGRIYAAWVDRDRTTK